MEWEVLALMFPVDSMATNTYEGLPLLALYNVYSLVRRRGKGAVCTATSRRRRGILSPRSIWRGRVAQ